MTQRLSIPPERLTWAIDRAGKSVEEMMLKVPQLADWLSGSKQPTFKQLQAFAKKVYLPFGYLFTKDIPQERLSFPFFRTQQGEQYTVPLNVYDQVQLLRQRQDWLSEYLRDNDFDPLDFVGNFDVETAQPADVVDRLRSILELTDNWASQLPTWTAALGHLKRQAENVGIIVVSGGVVGGNSRRPIEVEDCRGFVLVDVYAPFVFINSRDAVSAQLFTLAHELAHILLGESAGFDYVALQPAPARLETICDGVAAELLVPARELLDAWPDTDDFERLARRFKVSPIVIGRRALDLGLIDRERFFAFYYQRMAKFAEKKQKQTGGSGDYYNTARSRLSPTFAAHVNAAVQSGYLLHDRAYQLTGMKASTFATFMNDKL